MLPLFNCNVPLPIKLNCWKHHTGFIKQQLYLIKDENDFYTLLKRITIIGESQMDLYTGKIRPEDIAKFVIEYLKKISYTDYSSYKKWLHKNSSEYKMITLPDKSDWALRLGNEVNRFVHIHPGRYSAYSIRVRALTLKTAICVLGWNRIRNDDLINTEKINFIRTKHLNAEPVKTLAAAGGLRKIISILK